MRDKKKHEGSHHVHPNRHNTYTIYRYWRYAGPADGGTGDSGTIGICSGYADGFKGIEGFSHLILIYAFHHSASYQLTVTPFLDTTPRGVFATRAPSRPNAIGLSIVRLIEVIGTTLVIEDADILDGTPLLDLKPYVPAFDSYPDAASG
jgi:tRNA-Thr(GGU) m(6)t(6)A37 methyltransferase TsaA